MEATFDREFWQRHPGLVWSNPKAGDSVRIRAALVHPRFRQLLDIAARFGLERVHSEWAVLEAEGADEARRAAPIVMRILRNLNLGQSFASTGN